MPIDKRAHTCGPIAFLNREEHLTNPGISVISPGNRRSKNSSCTRRTAFSRWARSLASVDFPAAILPHKKINFPEMLMSSYTPRQYEFREVELTSSAQRGSASRGQDRPVLVAHTKRGDQPWTSLASACSSASMSIRSRSPSRMRRKSAVPRWCRWGSVGRLRRGIKMSSRCCLGLDHSLCALMGQRGPGVWIRYGVPEPLLQMAEPGPEVGVAEHVGLLASEHAQHLGRDLHGHAAGRLLRHAGDVRAHDDVVELEEAAVR